MAIPKVTVGIPSWNGERFIGDAIQSVLDQRFTDLEVIVVDDHSVDSTVEIVRSFADPRIALYENERRLGIPRNWNRVLSLARGEYVCLFHQDDRMHPDNLARKAQLLDADPTIGFVHSDIEVLIDPSAPYPPAQWVEDSTEDFIIDGPVYFRRLLLEGNLICAPTVLARREELLRVGGFDPELGFACDYALWMNLCLDRRVAFLSQPLVQYRWHAGNETHHYRFEKGVQEAYVASQRVLSYYRQRPGREQEAEVLRASLDALVRVRRWAAALASAKEWQEGQVRNWQAEAERREQTIAELQAGNAQLESDKAWLEEQVRNWQADVERREAVIVELRAWNAQLESDKAWLEGQTRNWEEEMGRREQVVLKLGGMLDQQREAVESLHKRAAELEEDRLRLEVALRDLEQQAWMRIGQRLRLVTPPSAKTPGASKAPGSMDT